MSATTDRLLAAYLPRLRLTGYRPNTIDDREGVVRAFAGMLAPRELPDATRLDVEAFLGRDLAPESRRAYRGHLKALVTWAAEEGYAPTNPVEKVATIRVPAASPRPLSEADLLLALAAADGRMRAWLLLMALVGLRCVEVAHRRPQDVIESGGRTLLYLRETKGGGAAHVPAHPLIVQALSELPLQWSFRGVPRPSWPTEPVWWYAQRNYVSGEVRQHLRSVGVNATAQQLRHFAGTSWYRASGHDLLATAALLRHKNVKTTMVYAQLDPTGRRTSCAPSCSPASATSRPRPRLPNCRAGRCCDSCERRPGDEFAPRSVTGSGRRCTARVRPVVTACSRSGR